MNRPCSTLEYSTHAWKRLAERSIPKALVEDAVRNGSRRKVGQRQLFLLRSTYGYSLARKLFVVLEGPVVITAYWLDTSRGDCLAN